MVQRTTPSGSHPPLGQTTFYFGGIAWPRPVVVYGRGPEYVVRDLRASRESPERRYHHSVVDRIRRCYAGRTVTAKQISDEARLGISPLGIPAAEAPRVVRDLLVILAATGEATADVSSADTLFTLAPRREPALR